jgi:hypothetical protein
MKRGSQHVPGSEIYRNSGVSVYELDGDASADCCFRLDNLANTLCQHAVVRSDITKCVYYVMYKWTVEDERSCHFVGFVSKVNIVSFILTV